MRVLRFVFSAALFAAGTVASLALAIARYEGEAQRSILITLLLTAAACIIAIAAVRLFMPRARFYKKILCYVALVSLMTALSVAYSVGIDGVLPRHDGTQDVGLAVLAANADLFALIIGAAAAACYGFFRVS